MSKVARPRVKTPEREPAPEPAPKAAAPAAAEEASAGLGSAARERVATYAFGTIVCGAAMVAAAAWMGGSLGAFGGKVDAGVDALAGAVGFEIDRIVVVGLNEVVEARVLAASGIEVGGNMFRADPYAIRERVEAVDSVAGVSVFRFWPDQITIVAESREPLALWRDGEEWKVIDYLGQTFADARPEDFLHLPRVEGEGGDVAAASLLATLGDHPELEKRLDTAIRVGGRRWDIRFDGGVSVALPEDKDIAAALNALSLIEARSRLLDMPVSRIDARHPDRFAIRPVTGAPDAQLIKGA